VGRLRESGRAFAHAFRSRELRRLQLAGAGSTLAVWAYSIAIAVYAYREDGANAVGIVLFVRWSLAAVFAPWLALLADRMSRRRVMLAVDVSRVGLVAGMTIVAAGGGPSLVTYTLAVVMSIISTGFAPAQAALLPTLAKTPEELTAANLALNTISSVGMFAGPAIGGVFLAFSGPWLVFALTGASYLWSAACVLGLPRDAAPEQPEESAIGAQMFVAGALEVVIVVDAIRVLDAGNAGVGWLNTALGVGGLGGGLVGIVLAARKRLASDFRLGLAVFGAGLALLAASTSFGAALVLFAVMGIGSTLVDVTGMTLLQRSAPSHVVGRVFGVLQSLMLATVAVGSLVTPLLVSALGPRETFVAIGLLLPALAAVTWRAVSAIDASARIPTEPLELLRAISIFAPLPEAVLERLAAAASEVRVMPDATVFAQGDSGDRFYVVAEGTARVVADGAEKARPSAGDFFGEIALLRDVPRTATVTAVDALRLYALERDAFLAAVTGHATSREAADGVVAARLPAGAAL
jgi:MFS family permease